jgi:hypothetical protein
MTLMTCCHDKPSHQPCFLCIKSYRYIPLYANLLCACLCCKLCFVASISLLALNKYWVIQTQGNNQINNAISDISTSVPDFTGKPILTKITTVAGSIITTVKTAYIYDQANRILALDQTHNGTPVLRVAAYEYNELGQLVKKNLKSLNGGAAIPATVNLDSNTQFPGNSLTS